jgi:hypothetical protein
MWKRLYAIRGTASKDWFSGSPDDRGYLRLELKGKTYKCHRLAWFYVTGKWPIHCIDHINQIKSDNRFSNLRDVSLSINQLNKKKYSNDKISAYKGVNFKKKINKWRAVLTYEYVIYHLGYFNTEEEAKQAYEHKLYAIMEGVTKAHAGRTIDNQTSTVI